VTDFTEIRPSVQIYYFVGYDFNWSTTSNNVGGLAATLNFVSEDFVTKMAGSQMRKSSTKIFVGLANCQRVASTKVCVTFL
jgi:hypothetical protein